MNIEETIAAAKKHQESRTDLDIDLDMLAGIAIAGFVIGWRDSLGAIKNKSKFDRLLFIELDKKIKGLSEGRPIMPMPNANPK